MKYRTRPKGTDRVCQLSDRVWIGSRLGGPAKVLLRPGHPATRLARTHMLLVKTKSSSGDLEGQFVKHQKVREGEGKS